jgi:hypothetical protein
MSAATTPKKSEVPKSESEADLHAKEVTSPGLWKQRKHEVKQVEEHAGAPVIWTAWINRWVPGL